MLSDCDVPALIRPLRLAVGKHTGIPSEASHVEQCHRRLFLARDARAKTMREVRTAAILRLTKRAAVLVSFPVAREGSGLDSSILEQQGHIGSGTGSEDLLLFSRTIERVSSQISYIYCMV